MVDGTQAVSSKNEISQSQDTSQVKDELARKRLCTGIEQVLILDLFSFTSSPNNLLRFRDSTSLIRVEVGGEDGKPEGVWLLHENVLVANSGLAKAAITHDAQEKAVNTIKLPEACVDSFNLFANYLYSRRLEGKTLSLDDLFAAYVLADYMDCPTLADLIFEEIHSRDSGFSTYTPKQIHYVLTNTLPDQPLHIMLLDQVSRSILNKRCKFNETDMELLQPVTGEILNAVMKTITVVSPDTFVESTPLLSTYHNHVGRHVYPKKGPSLFQTAKQRSELTEHALTKAGRAVVETVMRRTSQSEEAATKSLRESGYDVEKAVATYLQGTSSNISNPAGGSTAEPPVPNPQSTNPASSSAAASQSQASLFQLTPTVRFPATPALPSQYSFLFPTSRSVSSPLAPTSSSTAANMPSTQQPLPAGRGTTPSTGTSGTGQGFFGKLNPQPDFAFSPSSQF